MKRILSVTAALVAMVTLWSSAAIAQAGVTISGRVVNEGGAPLPAVNVFIQGMNVGAQTGQDGRYSFTIAAARATGQTVTLTARVIGFTAASTQITLVAGQNHTRDFALKPNPLQLGEVVVTGAGTTSTRERIGNVINTVDSSAIRRATEPQNIVSGLAGKAPNVEVRTQSGEPGASSSIKIRGNPSISGTNQPLFVVDGQPIDNQTLSTDQSPGSFPGTASTVTQNRAADINPNDIESIEILKGAAAAAIYGARAANGVVLITTKRGRIGVTQITLSTTNTWDNVVRTQDMQQSYAQGLNGINFVCGGPDCFAGGTQNASWGALIPAGSPTYNHAKEVFNTGFTSDNFLSVAGGNDRTTFYGSGGLTLQDGVLKGPNNKYNRTSVRLKGSQQAISSLVIGGNFNYIDTRGRYVQKGSDLSGLLLGALRTPPSFDNHPYLDPVTGLQRSYRFPQPSLASDRSTRGYDNPFFTLANTGNTSELGRFIGNANADWTPLPWLIIRETLGVDYYADDRLETTPLTGSNFPTGRVIRTTVTNMEIDNNLIATANKTFYEWFTGRLTLGNNLNSRRYRLNTNRGDGLNAPSVYELSNTLSIVPFEDKTLQHTISWFLQAEADLYNQLYVTAGLRTDGYSTFGSSNRWATFPKISAAWNFTQAMGNTDQTGLLSYGKLRAAYGETGREPIDVYGTITAFSLTNTFGSGFGDILNQSQSGQGALTTDLVLGNPGLKPERSRESEVGADFGFFNQMADLGFTYYYKRSSDVILRAPVSAAATGSIFQLKNAAKINNQGIELTFNIRPVTNDKVDWSVGFNYGRNSNLVKSLAGAQYVILANQNEGFNGAIGTAYNGSQVGVLLGNDFARCGYGQMIDITGSGVLANIDSLCALTPGGNGKFKKGALFIGDDGLPVLDPTDRVIANPNPRYTMGITTAIKLMNNLTISALFDFRKGGDVWNGTRGALLRFGTNKESLVRTKTNAVFGTDWLSKRYPVVAGPGAGTVAFNTPEDWQNWFLGDGGGFGSVSAQFVEDGSFVKWRELGLTYSFNHKVIREKTGFSSIDVRIAGRNLRTWTNYSGLDPETSLGGAEWLTQGVDFFGSPNTRSFVLSFTLNR